VKVASEEGKRYYPHIDDAGEDLRTAEVVLAELPDGRRLVVRGQDIVDRCVEEERPFAAFVIDLDEEADIEACIQYVKLYSN
jgi:hypothetical protein